jgi:predicted nucleic acid-binding protein
LGTLLITLDTSGLLALLSRRDAAHRQAVSVLKAETRPFLVPAAVLGEIAYFIERRSPETRLMSFLDDLLFERFTLDCGEYDLPRVKDLVGRYADLPLGLVDAAVIACAGRNGGRVLTLDLRHFGVVAREGRLTLLP